MFLKYCWKRASLFRKLLFFKEGDMFFLLRIWKNLHILASHCWTFCISFIKILFTSALFMISPLLTCCGDSFVFFPCDSLPPALHFVFLNPCKVPLDTSGGELCNFSHQEDICNRAEVLVLTQFLLIYYLSSQVSPQTFITPATDKRLFFGSKSTCKNNHAWIVTSWKYNFGGNS